LDPAAGLAGNVFQGLSGLVRVGAGEMNHVSPYDSVHATRIKVCDEMVREALGLERADPGSLRSTGPVSIPGMSGGEADFSYFSVCFDARRASNFLYLWLYFSGKSIFET
jgi:hypothetical protein